MFKRLLAMLLVGFVFVATARPKYVFMFIGDGMSIPQRTIAEEFLQKTRGEQLVFNHFPYNAATKTSSANGFITDSAASGTALACGSKTNNGMLGVLPDGVTPVESSAVIAKRLGMKVGIITSVTINHATPAAFYAHVKSRGMSYDIGLDLLASGFEYFAGGGCSGVNDTKNPKYRGNLYEIAEKEFGYKVGLVKNSEDMKKYGAGDAKVWIRGSEGYLNACLNDDGKSVQLSEYVAKGIEILDNPNGFFMMCEGGAIDSGGHANDAGYTLGEELALNEAVKVAYEFAKKHADETLIVVTGDHETGGLTLGFANTGIGNHIERLTLQKRTGGYLSGKVFERVHGKGEVKIDVVKDLVKECFSLTFEGDANDPMVLKADEITELEASFNDIVKKDIVYQNMKKDPNADDKKRSGARKAASDASGAFARKVQKCFCKRSGLMYTTGSHSALPVITSAWGCGAEAFKGNMRDAIAKKMDNLSAFISYKTPQTDSAKIEGDYENTEVSIRLKAILQK